MDGPPLDTRPDRPAARQTRRALLAMVAPFAAPRGLSAAAVVGRPAVETLLVLPVTSPDPPYPWFSIRLMTLEPGSVESFGRTEFHGTGDIGFVVNQGEIGFEVDGPALVARTGGNVLANGIPVAAGSVTRLLPGDQAVTGAGVVSRRRNTGSVRAATCELSATDNGQIVANHDGIRFWNAAPECFPRLFADGSPATHAIATLLRVGLPPDAQLRLRDVPHAEMLVVENGTVDLFSGANPLVASGLSSAPKRMLRLMPPSGQSALAAMFDPKTIFRRGSAEPATMLVATLTRGTAPAT